MLTFWGEKVKPIIRVDSTEEEWNNSDAKRRYDAAIKSKHDYEAYRAKFDSPEEVEKRQSEHEIVVQRQERNKIRQQVEWAKYEKEKKEGAIINNKQYYFMIENQIRKLFPLYEVKNILPLVEDVLKTSNILFDELKDFPIEGYYYKNEQLKRYFKIVRNIQDNPSLWDRVKQDEECFKLLKATTDLELFGKVQSDKSHGLSILPRRYDILALSSRDESVFDIYSSNPGWDIQKIVDNLKNHFTNTPNLVELAYLTGELEPLICGAETNALYRDLGVTKGMNYEPEKEWNVDKEVETMGKAVIDEYNKRFKLSINTPTLQNYKKLSRKPERPRVAAIGYITQTDTNYFWRSDLDGNVTDIYTKDFLTTETEKNRLNQEESEDD